MSRSAPDGSTGSESGTGGRGDAEVSGGDDTVPRSARWLVAVLLVTLLVPGLIGFELWPLTGWRLFSLSRDDTATRWVLEGVQEDGSARLVDPEELPLAYRTAEWPLRSVPSASLEEREEICTDLLDAVVEADPEIVALRIARDSQRLVQEDGEWTVAHDLDVRYSCGQEPS